MSTIEEDQDTLRSGIIITLLLLLSIGLIGLGLYGVKTESSFWIYIPSFRANSTDLGNTHIEYYTGRRAVGQGIEYISFGILSLTGLFWYLRRQANSDARFQILQLTAILLFAAFIGTLLAGTLVAHRVH